MASSRRMGKRAVGEDDRCRAALGRVLSRRFDEGHARGTKAELGEALGAEGRSGSTRVSRMIGGELFPDREFDVISEFVKLTVPQLLRAVAREIEAHEKNEEP